MFTRHRQIPPVEVPSFHALGTQTLPRNPPTPLPHLQLLQTPAQLPNHRIPHHLHLRTGESPPTLHPLRLRLCSNARTHPSPDQRTRTRLPCPSHAVPETRRGEETCSTGQRFV